MFRPTSNLFRAACCLLLSGLVLAAGLASAGEVRLKNGFRIEGKPYLLQSLKTGTVQNPGPTNIYPIVLVQTGLQRYFVPLRQIPDGGLNRDAELSRYETFTLRQRKSGSARMVAEVGAFAELTPFDEFGRRRVTLNTPHGQVPIIQGITKITPQYVTVTGLSHQWEHGLSIASLDPQVLDSILRKATDPGKPEDRMAIARFYLQAELYRPAQQELNAIAREFPELKSRVEQVQQELMQLRARQVLSELQNRRGAGQHRLAYQAARLFPPEQVGAAVMRDVRQFIAEYDQAREKGEKALALLGELQAGIDDPKLMSVLPLYRSVVNDELNYESLERLEPFLRAESDQTLSPAEKLALAYSGWVVGAAQAVTDLNQTSRLWNARFLALEYLRTEDPNVRKELLEKLKAVEGVGPQAVLNLIPLLPLPLESPVTAPGVPTPVQVSREGAEINVRYSVVLPPEYTPHHRYPLLVALRPAERTTEQILEWWAGSAEKPGHAQRQGYIVIAPEYAEEDERKYNYGIPAHHIVLESIRDARKRFQIDSDRIFLAGHGMGGDAAFDIGMSHPDEFAGVIPICGVCDEYCKWYWENGRQVGWYIVAGELDRSTFSQNAEVLDRMFKYGFAYDLIYAVYDGRGYETYFDELPKLFDWMALHRREKFPKEFEMQVLRQTDNRSFWLQVHDLPRTVILPQPEGAAQRVTPMKFSARATPGNTIHIETAGNRHTVWLSPEIVDFNSRVTIRINHRQRYNEVPQPDVGTILEDLRTSGDRQKLYWTRLDL